MATQKPKNILVAPLDWGLGHTTRCVPLIRYLAAQGHRVYVAGNEWQQTFIKAIFPQIDTVPLEGYNVTYSRWNRWAQIGMLAQLPRLHKTIQAEHSWLQRAVQELQLDGVIADNRYGLYHNQLPCVIMTHQLRVQTGMGNIPDNAVQRLHYKYLNRFGGTWVVDTEMKPGLGGTLSHALQMPNNTRYIGLLSQFPVTVHAGETPDELLVLLSGPEPLRGQLAQVLWQQSLAYEGRVTFVAGSAGAAAPAIVPAHITYHKWVADEQLRTLLDRAGIVICRSGYSTIMDLVALGKKAILIPTPGQTEQAYLARQLQAMGAFRSMEQKGFDLNKAMRAADKFPYKRPHLEDAYTAYQHVIDEWVQTI